MEKCFSQQKYYVILTLIHLGFLTYVKTWGGVIMAPLNFSPYYLGNKPPNGQKTPSGSSQTYSDVKRKKFHRNWLKNEDFTIFTNFGLKKVKISNFELQKCFVPQKKAENMYNTDLARKSNISCRKIIFFRFFYFSLKARGPPKIFDIKFSDTFKKNFQK